MLCTLPMPGMVIIGTGVIALDIVSNFFNIWFQWIHCSKRLFQSKGGDKEVGKITQNVQEGDRVTFLTGTAKQVNTLRPRGDTQDDFPLLKLIFGNNKGGCEIECSVFW
jgi:hypothetical protein